MDAYWDTAPDTAFIAAVRLHESLPVAHRFPLDVSLERANRVGESRGP
jgi:hypothetical protein